MKNIKYPKPPGTESLPMPPSNRSGSIPNHQRNPEIRRYLLTQEKDRLERERRRLAMRFRRLETRLEEIDETLNEGNHYPGQLSKSGGSGNKGWNSKKLKY